MDDADERDELENPREGCEGNPIEGAEDKRHGEDEEGIRAHQEAAVGGESTERNSEKRRRQTRRRRVPERQGVQD